MKLSFFIIPYLFINDPDNGRTVTKTRYVQTERTKMPKTILSTYIYCQGFPRITNLQKFGNI